MTLRRSDLDGSQDLDIPPYDIGGRIVVAPLNVRDGELGMHEYLKDRLRVAVTRLMVGKELCCVFVPPDQGVPEEGTYKTYKTRDEMLADFDQLRNAPKVFAISVTLLQSLLKGKEWDLPKTAQALKPARPGSGAPESSSAKAPVIVKRGRPPVALEVPKPPLDAHSDAVLLTVQVPLGRLDARAALVKAAQPVLGGDIDDEVQREGLRFDEALNGLEALSRLRPDQITVALVRPFLQALLASKAFFQVPMTGPQARRRVVEFNARLGGFHNGSIDPSVRKQLHSCIQELNTFLELISKR